VCVSRKVLCCSSPTVRLITTAARLCNSVASSGGCLFSALPKYRYQELLIEDWTVIFVGSGLKIL